MLFTAKSQFSPWLFAASLLDLLYHSDMKFSFSVPQNLFWYYKGIKEVCHENQSAYPRNLKQFFKKQLERYKNTSLVTD